MRSSCSPFDPVNPQRSRNMQNVSHWTRRVQSYLGTLFSRLDSNTQEEFHKPPYPGGNTGVNLKSNSHRCHPILVAFVWEFT